jgi:DNA invertase Pin-like site-specific DNA recombinase
MKTIDTLSDLGGSTADIVKAIDTLTRAGIPLHIKDIDVTTLRPDGTPDPAGTLVRDVLEQASRIDNAFFNRRLNAGRERYIESGGRLGRPKGSGMTPEQTLEKYPGVASWFDQDSPATIEEIAAEEQVSPSTVKKVKKAKMLWLRIMESRKKEMEEFIAMNSDDAGPTTCQ